MSILPVGAAPLQPASAQPTQATQAGAGGSFSDLLGQALDALQSTDTEANNLSIEATAGQGNVADVMVATTEATLATDLAVAVRNKAVDAFNQIMGMQF
jgi:flagellar hook-basal body complex protein FliE